MALSWHENDYQLMVEEMEEYFLLSSEPKLQTLTLQDIHGIVGKMVTIMIDHGAVDPT